MDSPGDKRNAIYQDFWLQRSFVMFQH